MNTQENTISEKPQHSVEETHRQSYSEETEIHDVPNTPFKIVRQEKEWYVLMGKYALSAEHQTKEEALADAQAITWDRIIKVMIIIAENNQTNE